MKSIYFALFVLLFVSCNDDDDNFQTDFTEENEQEIVAYIAANGLDATRSSSGLYYVIDEVGEGAEITATSEISVRYKGFYTDGKILDESTDEGISLNLQQTIPGWIEGLQYFREGGKGTLLIPSHLAYGFNDYNGIPGGSVLIFEIDIIDYDAENKEEILKYISDNDLNATATGSGLYYIIDEEGTGPQPVENSEVTIVYKGYYTDNLIFDESEVNGVDFNLNQVIPGMSEGLQYFKEGGTGTLIIPSSLAYGRYGNPIVRGGAVVIFDVELKSVN